MTKQKVMRWLDEVGAPALALWCLIATVYFFGGRLVYPLWVHILLCVWPVGILAGWVARLRA